MTESVTASAAGKFEMIGSRYQLGHKDTVPGELPRAADFGSHVELKHGSVPDPNPAYRGQRQRVAINTKTDPLEKEYAAGNISESAYIAGRTYQRVVEKSRTPVTGAGQWMGKDKVDVTVARDLNILQNLANADAANRIIVDARNVAGFDAEKVLTAILIDGRTFRDLAGAPRSWRHQKYLAGIFRSGLESLASYWAVYGEYGL